MNITGLTPTGGEDLLTGVGAQRTYSENDHPNPSFTFLLWVRIQQQKIRAMEKMLKCGIRRSTADRILSWKITTVAMVIATLLAVVFVAIWLLIALIGRAVMKNQDRDM